MAKKLLIDRVRRQPMEEVYLAELASFAGQSDSAPSVEVIALQALEQLSKLLMTLALPRRLTG